jgi:hypothetical protein
MRSKILMAVGVIAVIGVLGVGIGYLGGGGSGAVPPAPAPPSGGGDQRSSSGGDQPTQATPVVEPTPVMPIQSNTIAQAETNPPAASTNWEDTVDDIVGSDDADTNKVKQLFALFPKLPPDGQEEVAQHLSNLVEDDNYGPLGDMLKNASLPQGVLDELMSDVLNRPNSLKLPMLLDVAQDPNNPEHDEAKDLLTLYLGEEPSDWSQAGPMVTNWLQQNPD